MILKYYAMNFESDRCVNGRDDKDELFPGRG